MRTKKRAIVDEDEESCATATVIVEEEQIKGKAPIKTSPNKEASESISATSKKVKLDDGKASAK